MTGDVTAIILEAGPGDKIGCTVPEHHFSAGGKILRDRALRG